MTTVNIAVLFTDIVGSTETQSRMSPDVADELRRAHFTVLRQAITSTGGSEVKSLGDGLMVVFSSASSAIACAVAMQQRVEIEGRSRPVALQIRVGLSAGEATSEDGDFFGDAVIEAARLCAACEPGVILASDVVRLMAGRRNPHATQRLGPMTLKGLPGEVDVVQVLWEPVVAAEEGLQDLPGVLKDQGQLPFVGRERETAQLESAYADAAGGAARLVLVAGEPGIGKTRLVSELARKVLVSGGRVLAGRSDEMVGIPYQPFAEALRFSISQPGGVDQLGTRAGELLRLVPELAAVVDGLGAPLSGSAESERLALFAGVRQWLSALSETQPVLFVLDDLHWADLATLLLLRHIVVNEPVPRLLAVGTYRDTDLGRKHPLSSMLADFRRRSDVARVALRGLEEVALEQLIATAGHRETDESTLMLAASLREETDGNPFFAGEILRHLVETQTMMQPDGRWMAGADAAEAYLPESIRDVIGRRVSVLPDETQRLLITASVAGTSFDLDLLAAISDVTADEALDALDPALAAHLVVETGIGTYRFAHALVRSTLEAELSATRRARLHLAVAKALEALHSGDLDAVMEELAHHWGEAGAAPSDTAPVLYANRAGELATMRGAPDEAAAWYRIALERLDGADRRLQAVLLNALGQSQARARQPDFLDSLLEAAEIAAEVGDFETVVDALTRDNRGENFGGSRDPEPAKVAELERALSSGSYDVAQRIRLTMALAQEALYQLDFPRRRELFEQALALTDQLPGRFDRTIHEGRNEGAWPYPLLTRSNVDRYMSCTPAELAEAWAQPDREKTQIVIWMYFWGSVFRGDPAFRDAVEEQRRLLSVFPSMEVVSDLPQMEIMRALIDGRFGDLRRLHRELRDSFDRVPGALGPDASGLFGWVIARETVGVRVALPTLRQLLDDNDSPWPVVVEALLAVSLAEAGETEEAAALVDRNCSSDFESLREDLTYPMTVTSWAQAAAIVGHAPACRVLYDLLLPTNGMHQATGLWYAGSTDRYLAVLSEALGDHVSADRWFASAVAGHQRLKSPPWLVRSRLDWAEHLAGRGEIARARTLALAALEEIGSLELNVSRARAEALLTAHPK